MIFCSLIYALNGCYGKYFRKIQLNLWFTTFNDTYISHHFFINSSWSMHANRQQAYCYMIPYSWSSMMPLNLIDLIWYNFIVHRGKLQWSNQLLITIGSWANLGFKHWYHEVNWKLNLFYRNRCQDWHDHASWWDQFQSSRRLPVSCPRVHQVHRLWWILQRWVFSKFRACSLWVINPECAVKLHEI